MLGASSSEEEDSIHSSDREEVADDFGAFLISRNESLSVRSLSLTESDQLSACDSNRGGGGGSASNTLPLPASVSRSSSIKSFCGGTSTGDRLNTELSTPEHKVSTDDKER
ncbi:unnamed protein product [Soboliphyme baturini]|uniref:CTNNB1_binding domain-containing protein n=1 Tax=Soboliphyme baturini TaxID=241478 RepID=A0A183IA39_9BILA|nr:unnamed protein product [Soboliphyme baturini]